MVFEVINNSRVLIVEDDPISAKLHKKMVESLDNSFYAEVLSSLQDLFKVSIHEYDVILLDLNLPDSNGLETLEKVVAKFSTIPVVVITGAYGKDLGLKAISLGAQDYLVKGQYAAYELEKAVHCAIEKKRVELNLEQKTKNIEKLVSLMSHELRNPLTITKGLATLLEEIVKDNRIARHINSIVHSVEKMTAILDAVMELLKIGKKNGLVQEIDVATMIAELKKEVCKLYPDKVIEFKVSKDLWCVLGDKNLIKEVFWNLIKNAVVYQAEGSLPVVEIGSNGINGRYIEFFIRDNGIGIDLSFQEKIFELFTRVKEIKVDGFGVGLAVVLKIITYYKGKIRVKSAKGKGSVFYFTLPAGGL